MCHLPTIWNESFQSLSVALLSSLANREDCKYHRIFAWMAHDRDVLTINEHFVNLSSNIAFYFYLITCFFLLFLLGEIGGNMGLFLGCSLMTIFEFADLLVALLFVRTLHKEYQT